MNNSLPISSKLKELRSLPQLWFEAWAGILFLPRNWSGALLAALACLRPGWALFSFVAVCTAHFTLKLSGKCLRPMPIHANAMLTGLFIGTIARPGFSSLMLAVGAAVFCTFLSRMLEEKFVARGLPLLSLPYAIITPLIGIAAWRQHGLYNLTLEEHLLWPGLDQHVPLIIASFLKAMGSILFMSDLPCGLAIFLVLLLHSRLLTAHALIAFLWGVCLHALLLGSWRMSLLDPFNFNFVLIGVSIGAIFLTPSPRSLALNLLAVSAAVPLIDSLSDFALTYRLGVFTLPFNIITLLTLGALRLNGSRDMPLWPRKNPEATLEGESRNRRRFTYEPAIELPFAGECQVYQGFDGAWTHKGDWQHAVDFVRLNEHGNSFNNQGLLCQDYPIFGMEVLSPVSGRIIEARDDIHDNIPGHINHQQNWGNYVILLSDEGWFIEISHLLQFSLKVRVGDRIDKRQLLALCGNSGYSAYPHLHIQAQWGAGLGSPTRPFSFSHSLCGSNLSLNAIPRTESLCSSLATATLPMLFHLNASQALTLTNEKGDEKSCLWQMKRSADQYATPYLEDETGAKLYLSLQSNMATVLRFEGKRESSLHALALAAPHLPFTGTKEAVAWDECLVEGVRLKSQLRRQGKLLFQGLFGLDSQKVSNFKLSQAEGSGLLLEGVHPQAGKTTQPLTTSLQLSPSGILQKLQFGQSIIEAK